MARAIENVASRRFTVEEYHRMAEAGIFDPDERVELVHGVVRQMSPKSRAHVIAVDLVASRLRDALRGRASVYQGAPLLAEGIDSEPEPDVLVCSNPDRTAYGTPKTTPLLVVEVADTSLTYDAGEKASLYAEAGVPEYWVLDLSGRSLVAFREPAAEGYRERRTLEGAARVTSAVWPGLELDVGSLLP